jgi:hypothetical protein
MDEIEGVAVPLLAASYVPGVHGQVVDWSESGSSWRQERAGLAVVQ